MTRHYELSADSNSWDEFSEANAPEHTGAGGGFDLAMLLRRKWWLVLGLVAGLLLSLLQYARNDPVYESQGQILIRERTQAPLDEDGTAATLHDSTTVLNHAYVMSSSTLIYKAVNEHALAKLPSLATSADPAVRAAGGISVAPLDDDAYSGVYTITYRGPNPQDGPEIIDALITTYEDFLGSAYEDVSDELIGEIAQARDILHKDLEARLDAYKAKYEVSDYLLMTDGEFTNTHLDRQAKLEATRDEARRNLREIRTKIRTTEAALQDGANPVALLLSLERQAGQTLNMAARDATTRAEDIRALEVEMAALSSNYGANHPKIKAVRRRIGILREMESRTSTEEETDATSQKSTSAREMILIYLDVLRREADAAEEELQQLDAEYEIVHADAVKLGAELASRQNDHKLMQKSEQLLDGIVESLQQASLAKNVGGSPYRFDILEAPGIGAKVAPSLSRFLGMGIALGLLAGAALAQFVDRADQRFKNPDDIARTLRLPVVGHIPEVEARRLEGQRDLPLAPHLITAHRPECPESEAYRVVRTALYFGVHGKRHQVIQVTSPLPEDGKSTLIANLAISIAQSGKRVLLLDADLRRPVQHQQFGLANDTGLASVVVGTAEPPTAIQQTAVANLSVMTAGPRPQNPAEILTSLRFEELINLLRDQFDFVLVDTPPLLAVTDPSAVAARVDAVLLVLRLGKSSRSGARSACAMLRDLGVEVIGTVVNRLDPRKRGHGYGYGYGYGYGTAYGAHAYGQPGSAYSHYVDEPHNGSNGHDGAEANKSAAADANKHA